LRKLLVLCLVVFAVAFAVGLSTPSADAAQCYYKCSCAGEPLFCCIVNGVEWCAPAIGFECIQRYDC
jgi:hypothetical protein